MGKKKKKNGRLYTETRPLFLIRPWNYSKIYSQKIIFRPNMKLMSFLNLRFRSDMIVQPSVQMRTSIYIPASHTSSRYLKIDSPSQECHRCIWTEEILCVQFLPISYNSTQKKSFLLHKETPTSRNIQNSRWWKSYILGGRLPPIHLFRKR